MNETTSSLSPCLPTHFSFWVTPGLTHTAPLPFASPRAPWDTSAQPRGKSWGGSLGEAGVPNNMVWGRVFSGVSSHGALTH